VRAPSTRSSRPRGYLPHLPRCHSCVARGGRCVRAGRPGHDDGLPGRAAPASGVDIRTAHGTDDENAASSALRAVLAAHDLRRSAAADELRQHAGYPWIYGQILASPPLLQRKRSGRALTERGWNGTAARPGHVCQRVASDKTFMSGRMQQGPLHV
jgi:hypothetical protein